MTRSVVAGFLPLPSLLNGGESIVPSLAVVA